MPDTIAVGDGHEAQDDWIKRNGVNRADQIRLTKLVHMRYQHPDLAEITQFLEGVFNYTMLNMRETLSRRRKAKSSYLLPQILVCMS